MIKLAKIFIVALLICPLKLYSQCLVVTPGGSGTGSGADWNNAISSANLTTNMVRGDTYYLATGSYGNQTFQTADSGTSVITIRAAISSDHCTATGWTSSLAATSAAPVSMSWTTTAYSLLVAAPFEGPSSGVPQVSVIHP